MRDLCEIILAHRSLFGGEWTVIRRQNVQSVAAGGTELKGRSHKGCEEVEKKQDESIL